MIAHVASSRHIWQVNVARLNTKPGRVAWEEELVKALRMCMTRFDQIKMDYSDNLALDKTCTISSTEKFLCRDPKDLSLVEKLFPVRHKVNIENLVEWLISQNVSDKTTFMTKFLGKNKEISALQFLPEMLKLHKFLLQQFDGKVPLHEVENISLEEFIGNIDTLHVTEF